MGGGIVRCALANAAPCLPSDRGSFRVERLALARHDDPLALQEPAAVETVMKIIICPIADPQRDIDGTDRLLVAVHAMA